MSATNSSDPTGGAGAGNATAPQIPPQVIAAVLEGYADGIRNPIGFVLVATIFASMLIPILIALFYFSTPTSRRQPAFILNVITILFGLGIAIWNNYLELAGVLNPTKQVSLKSVDGFAVVFGLAPWLAELVLALRLLVVFPPSQTSWRKLAAVFAFPVAVKIVRLACVITYFHNWIRETDSAANPLQAAETVDYKHSPYTKVDWFLQIFDNLYLSALFIGRLYHSQIFNAMSGRRANESTYTYPSEQNRVVRTPASTSIGSRLKFLFWIALGNFVIPVIFNIILIIDLYTDPNHIVNTVYLLFVNYYISIIGVVFATVWSSSFNYKQQQAVATLHGRGSSQGSWRPKPSVSATNETLTAPPMSPTIQGHHSFKPVPDKDEDWEMSVSHGSTGRDAIPLAMLAEKSDDGRAV